MFNRSIKKLVVDFVQSVQGKPVSSGTKRHDAQAVLNEGINSPATFEKMRETLKQRDGNKELLYGIMREAMVGAEILSSNYRFQVLTLDPEGLVQKVIIDIAPQYGNLPELVQKLESNIIRRAVSFGMRVSGLYWRCDPTLALVSAPSTINRQARHTVSGFAILSSDVASRITTGFEETQPHLIVPSHASNIPTLATQVGCDGGENQVA